MRLTLEAKSIGASCFVLKCAFTNTSMEIAF